MPTLYCQVRMNDFEELAVARRKSKTLIPNGKKIKIITRENMPYCPVSAYTKCGF